MTKHFTSNMRITCFSQFNRCFSYLVGAVGASVIYNDDFADAIKFFCASKQAVDTVENVLFLIKRWNNDGYKRVEHAFGFYGFFPFQVSNYNPAAWYCDAYQSVPTVKEANEAAPNRIRHLN
jgi:hypothetical protein